MIFWFKSLFTQIDEIGDYASRRWYVSNYLHLFRCMVAHSDHTMFSEGWVWLILSSVQIVDISLTWAASFSTPNGSSIGYKCQEINILFFLKLLLYFLLMKAIKINVCTAKFRENYLLSTHQGHALLSKECLPSGFFKITLIF